jgi:hypothetical protein
MFEEWITWGLSPAWLERSGWWKRSTRESRLFLNPHSALLDLNLIYFLDR